MWARRCGAPPLWPSRTKVFLQSFVTAALGVAVFNYLTSADLNFLDLSLPIDSEVLCLTEWPLRHAKEEWFAQDWYIDITQYTTDMNAFVNEHACSLDQPITGTCTSVNVPLQDMSRKLGTALGRSAEYQFNNDVLELYALVFLYLTVCMWVAVIVHDFTLLSQTYNNACLDMSGIHREFPKFRKLLKLMGLGVWKHCLERSKGVMKVLVWCAVPLVVVWALFVDICIINPVCLLVFLRYPIKLGRLQIFTLCKALTFLCLSLTLRAFVQLADMDVRPKYAVTWSQESCQCGCVYPMKATGLWQIVLLAVGIGYKSVMLGLRCLKGLRRANWANLITVMFAIPLTVYPVEWTQPDGKPIPLRTEDQPVQGEPAFDPFALMDEQKDSATTTCDLKASALTGNSTKGRKKKHTADKHTAPRMPTRALNEAIIYEEDIGCCGFPYFKRLPAVDNPEGQEGEGEGTTEAPQGELGDPTKGGEAV